jgi:hypothetical protein
VISIGFAFLAIFIFTYEIKSTLAALWLPVLLLLAVFTALGVGLWLSALNALYRDVRNVIPFVIQSVRFTRRVSCFARTLAMAKALLIEPHYQRHGGSDRAGQAARLSAFGLRWHGARDALGRIDLLQQDGVDHSGRGLAYAW